MRFATFFVEWVEYVAAVLNGGGDRDVRLACGDRDEVGRSTWIGRLASAKQVCRRGEVKGAASRTELHGRVCAPEPTSMIKKGFQDCIFCVIHINVQRPLEG